MRENIKTKKSNTLWSGKDIDSLLRMKSDGLSDDEVGLELGRSTKAIQVKTCKLRKQMRTYGYKAELKLEKVLVPKVESKPKFIILGGFSMEVLQVFATISAIIALNLFIGVIGWYIGKTF